MKQYIFFILTLVVLASCAKQEEVINLAPETPIEQINLPETLHASFKGYRNGDWNLEGEYVLKFDFNEENQLKGIKNTIHYSLLENDKWVVKAPIDYELEFIYENNRLMEVTPPTSNYNFQYGYDNHYMDMIIQYYNGLALRDYTTTANFQQVISVQAVYYYYDNKENIDKSLMKFNTNSTQNTIFQYDNKKHYLSQMNTYGSSAQVFLIISAIEQWLTPGGTTVPLVTNSNVNNPISVRSTYENSGNVSYTWDLDYPHHNDAGYPTKIESVFEGRNSHWYYTGPTQEDEYSAELPIREEYSMEITYKQVD